MEIFITFCHILDKHNYISMINISMIKKRNACFYANI